MWNPTSCLALLLTAFFSLSPGTPVLAQQQAAQPAAEQPVYKLPMRGAPASRVGGGTRGSNLNTPTVSVFAPDHTGLTVNTQPTLYWNLSKEAAVQVELTVLDEAGVKPLVEKVVTAPLKPGVHALSLKDAGVTLAPGPEYRWYVALVFDPKMRSSDVTSSGTIRVVPASDTLKRKLAETQPAGQPALYAAEGLWYDSVESLMRLIDASPGDTKLRDELDSLLTQVGLTRVADPR